MKAGDAIAGVCRCGTSVACKLRAYKNGTLHAYGACPSCQWSGPHRKPLTLETFKFKLQGIGKDITQMKPSLDRDEAVAMLERLADELHNRFKD